MAFLAKVKEDLRIVADEMGVVNFENLKIGDLRKAILKVEGYDEEFKELLNSIIKGNVSFQEYGINEGKDKFKRLLLQDKRDLETSVENLPKSNDELWKNMKEMENSIKEIENGKIAMEKGVRPSSGEISNRSVRGDELYREERRYRIEDNRSYPSSYVSPQHEKVSSSHGRRHERESYPGSRSHKSETHKRSSTEKTDETTHKPRRKHSLVNAPSSGQPRSIKQEHRGDLKFEPDYDGFGDIEEISHESKQEKKSKTSSPEPSRKVAQTEKVSKHDSTKTAMAKTSSVARSASSSEPSESNFSDSDELESSKKRLDKDYKLRYKKSKHKKKKKRHRSKRV